MRIIDWISDVCSSDLPSPPLHPHGPATQLKDQRWALSLALFHKLACDSTKLIRLLLRICAAYIVHWHSRRGCLSKSVTLSHVIFENTPCSSQTIRSEEHTSELQSLMRISSAVFCLKQKINTK